MTNWTDVMTRGLAARRQFRGSGGISIGRVNRREKENPHDTWRKQALAEKKVSADIASKEASTERTKAETERIDKLTESIGVEKEPTELQKAQTKELKLKNIASGLKNAVSHLPAVTRDTYSDYHSWITESNFVPKGTFASPEDVAKMTPLEFKGYKSSLSGLNTLDNKGLAALEKKKAAEKLATAKVTAAEKLATAKKLSDTDRNERRKVESAEKKLNKIKEIHGEREDVPPELLPKYDKLNEIVNEYYGVEEPPVEDIPMLDVHRKAIDNIQNQFDRASSIDPKILAGYKEKYPDKTDEEIMQAYNRLTK